MSSMDDDLGLKEWLILTPVLIALTIGGIYLAYCYIQASGSAPDASYQSQPIQQSNSPKFTCVKYSGIAGWFHGGNILSDSVMECK